MKVVFVHTLYAPRMVGGAERVVQTLAERLTATGHEVVVVSAAPRGEASDRTVNGVHVREVDLANVPWPYDTGHTPALQKAAFHAIDVRNPVMARRVGAILDDERPDVLHTHGLASFSALVWREARSRGIAVVHTLHDLRLICLHAGEYKRGRACAQRCISCRIAGALRTSLTSDVGVVVGISRDVLEAHVDAGLFTASQRDVVPVPLDVPVRSDARVIGDGPLRFGFLGRLDPVKGAEVLVDAARLLNDGGWSLRIAGGGDPRYVDALRDRARGTTVVFEGHVESVSFLDSIDVLVVPSVWREPAGLVAVEALARGAPVVASNRGGLSEIVTDGVGWLFDGGSPQSLMKVMRSLIADRVSVRSKSRATVAAVQRFTIDAVVSRYEDLYDDARRRRVKA